MSEAQPSASEAVPAFTVLQGLFATLPDLPPFHLVQIRARELDLVTACDGGDYDLLLPVHEHPEFFRRLMHLAQQNNVSFTLDQTNPVKCRITLHAPQKTADIVVEVWSHLEVRDPHTSTERTISWAVLAPLVVQNASGWHLPQPLEALYYLSHLATRKKSLNSPTVQQRLEHYRVTTTAPEILELLRNLAANKNISAAASAANRHLIARGLLQPLTGFSARCAAWWKAETEHRIRQRRRSHTRGGVFAFTGPDGVGKTTVITALCADLLDKAVPYRFKSLFRHNPLYNVLYALRYQQEAKAYGEKSGGNGESGKNGKVVKLEKNIFDELQAPALFHLARLGHPWLKVRAWLGAYRCCDRYYHELLFANLRRSGAQPQLRADWPFCAKKIPLPAWHLQLDAADAVILARKQELSPSALACYREGLFTLHLALKTPYYTYLNTGTSLDEVRATLRRAGAPLGLRFRP